MRVVTIVQARMTSTRLSGKVLKRVRGKSLLEYQVERLRRITESDELVLATTHNSIDDVLIDCCRDWNLKWFRGDENDVLDRYYRAAREFNAEAVVRVTSDCPLIDPEVIDRVIRTYRNNSDRVDYVANTLVRTYPRGMDCEIFSSDVLERTFREAVAGEREHVTRYIYTHPDQFALLGVTYERDESRHRWTVDTPDDFELIKRLLETVYPAHPEFTLEDCLEAMARNPFWLKINSHIRQKEVNESRPAAGETEAANAESSAAELSRLGLGTVQFGLDYGVANKGGRCDLAETTRILAEAERLGVRLLDTAPGYGEAEQVIGQVVGTENNFEFVGKTMPLQGKRLDDGAIKRILDCFEISCRSLKRNRLHGLLVHHAEDLLQEGGEKLMAALQKLKAEGRVDKLGVSVYEAAQLDAILARFEVDVIQLPLNLFDQRLLLKGYLDSLKQRGIEIHARSVFLQGLLLMPAAELPSYFEPLTPHMQKYEQELEHLGLSRLQAALGLVKGIEAVDRILIGVDSLGQFLANVEAFQSAPSLDYSEFALQDETFLDPRSWPAR